MGVARHLPASVSLKVQYLGVKVATWRNRRAVAFSWFEKYLIGFVIAGLIAGIGVASFSQLLVDRVDAITNGFMGLYDVLAPAAIFLILTPSWHDSFRAAVWAGLGSLSYGGTRHARSWRVCGPYYLF